MTDQSAEEESSALFFQTFDIPLLKCYTISIIILFLHPSNSM